ncbi:MAG: DnaJ domain-containing protein [Deltaproteobacteria bacterium]|nr:DnaJ domain-containing protein [Deltaproteobacteria bacterium]
MSLSPAELHLLDCIDGSLDADELSFTCGRAPSEVAAMLARLVDAHVVSLDVAPTAPPPKPARASFGDEIELSHEVRAEIDVLARRIEGADHYQVLGIAKTATKDDVRAAYYAVGPRFHPDRHFRKHLGPYKAKIEAVFSALTKAHDTLRFDARRATYDASLATPQRAPHRGATPAAAPSAAAAAAARPVATVAVETEEQRRARRDALARKLGATPTPVSRPPLDSPPPTEAVAAATRSSYGKVAGVQASAAEVMRARFEQVGNDMREKRIKRYLESAEDAMNLGDYRTAAAAYKQASKLDPADGDLVQKAAQAAKLAGLA